MWVKKMTEKALKAYDKTIEDVAEVIAEHLTVSESCLIRWYTEQFRIQFENNLKRSMKND